MALDLEQEFGWPSIQRGIQEGKWPSNKKLAEMVLGGSDIPPDMRRLIAGRLTNDPNYRLPTPPLGRPKYGAFDRMNSNLRKKEIADRKRRWERVYRDRCRYSNPATRAIEKVAAEYGVTTDAIEKAISAVRS